MTAVAILSLGLGIGANTAIFSIVDSLLLKVLPVERPDRLARLVQADGGQTLWSNPIWEAVRSHETLVGGAFAWWPTRFDLAAGGRTEFVDGLWASGRTFEVLGVQPLLGRTFTAADDRRGGGPDGPVAVIGYGFWQRRFGGAADVIGRTLTVERVSYTIVGVTPPSFFGVDVGRSFDVAVPIGTEPLVRGKESALDHRGRWWLNIMVRLQDGQTLEGAQAALRGILPQVREATVPQDASPTDAAGHMREGFGLTPAATGASFLRERYGRPLTTIMVVVGLVLLIACANIANLLLARATARRHDLSVRVALGASRWRIARQLLTESLLLSAAGATLGLAIAHWGSRLLVAQLSTATNTVFLPIGLDPRVLAFTTAVAVGTAVIFGLAPALRGARVQPQDALRAQGRGVAGDGRLGIGNTLVVLQVALSLVLVVAAGLFVRTFASLATLDVGFDRDPVLIASLSTTAMQLEPPARPALFARTLEAASAVPGVASAALSIVTPVAGSTWVNRIELPDRPDVPESERRTLVNVISSRYFETYGTRLLAGRDFAGGDTLSAPQVVIVNEAFARKFTQGASPIGLRIRQPGGPARAPVDRVVVGLVEDAVYRSLREPVPPTMYLPYTQVVEPPSSMALSVRSAGGAPALLARPLTAALTGVHGDIAITFRPLRDQVQASLLQERIVAGLSGFFGGLALLLAGIGLYGVTAYGVTRRREEIGIRLALGASPRGVVRLVLRRVAWLVGLGAITGAAVSLWAARFVTPLLHGLEPRDPGTMAGAVLVLAAVGALAGWLPARRAARIDPMRVLRES